MLFFFLQRLDPLAVFIALEGRGDRRADLADKALHVVAQLQPPAARQLQQARMSGIGEIIHITPVDRRHSLVTLLVEQVIDDGVAPAAWLAKHEKAVTLVRHFEAEVDRGDGTRMNQRRVEVGQTFGRRETEAVGITGCIQNFRSEFAQGGHLFCLLLTVFSLD